MSTTHFTAPPPSQSTPEPGTSSTEAAYRTLTTFLHTHASSVLELEILPNSHPAILQDGLSLAIPKKLLIQTFLIACKNLLYTPSPPRQPLNPPTPEFLALDQATKIILLYDPEHLSALNWRKRHITALATQLPRTSDTPSQNATGILQTTLPVIITNELTFLTTLLTSPLPKHPKSPSLWSHRHWLLRQHAPPPLSTILHREIHIVLQAASRHFADYHAFHYARRLVLLLSQPPKGASVTLGPQAVRGVLETVRKWCFAHPRDISGWGFLAWLVRWERERRDWRGEGGGAEDGARENVEAMVEKTDGFVKAVGWRGESVAWFLREVEVLREKDGNGRALETVDGVG